MKRTHRPTGLVCLGRLLAALVAAVLLFGSTTPTLSLDFEPDDLTGLKVWLDAGQGVVESGGFVTGWIERAEAGADDNATDPGAAARPTYDLTGIGGLPAIDLSGSIVDKLPVPLTARTEARLLGLTFSTSVDIVGSSTGQTVLGLVGAGAGYSDNPGADNWVGVALGSSTGSLANELILTAEGNARRAWTSGQASIPAGDHVFVMRYDATPGVEEYEFLLDGIELPMSSYGNKFVNDVTELTLGQRKAATDLDFSGKIAEIVLYDQEHTHADARTVSNYLLDKYMPNSPGTIDGLELWLDAGVDVKTTGSDVTAWIDRAGGGDNATAAAGQRPALAPTAVAGRPGVDFNGTTDRMPLGDLAAVGGDGGSNVMEGLMLVFRNDLEIDASSAPQQLAVLNDVNFGLALGSITAGLTDEVISLSNSGSGGQDRIGWTEAGASLSAGDHFLILRYDSVEGYQFFLDGDKLTGISTAGNGLFKLTANDVELGVHSGHNGFFFDGAIAEMMVFTQPVDDNDLNTLFRYVGQEYRLGPFAVPEPNSLGLLFSGLLAGLVCLRRRRMRR